MARSRGLLALQAFLVVLSLAACAPGERATPEGPDAPRCGSAGNAIDTRQLVDLPEQEAVALGRRRGCTVRVEKRDGSTVAAADRGPGYKTIGVAVQDGYVVGLCLWHSEDRCSASRG